MKRLVKVTVQAVVEVESVNEVDEVVGDVVESADWDIDYYDVEDCGEVEE